MSSSSGPHRGVTLAAAAVISQAGPGSATSGIGRSAWTACDSGAGLMSSSGHEGVTSQAAAASAKQGQAVMLPQDMYLEWHPADQPERLLITCYSSR